MRPLHSRLRRDPPQLGAGAAAARDIRPASPSINNLPMGNSSCVSCGECMVSCPTGALTNKRVVGTELAANRRRSSILPKLLHLPIFQNVSGTFLELNQNAVVKRRFTPGEIICREGEFGSTAFYILEGKAEVFLSSPIAHVKTRGQQQRIFQPARTACCSPREAGSAASEESDRPFIPIDASVDLALRQSHRRTRAGRPVRRDDLHELLPALGHGAREDRLRDAGNAAQRARHPAAQQDVPGATGAQLPRARAGFDHLRSVPHVRVPDQGFHRSLARPGGAGALQPRAR